MTARRTKKPEAMGNGGQFDPNLPLSACTVTQWSATSRGILSCHLVAPGHTQFSFFSRILFYKPETSEVALGLRFSSSMVDGSTLREPKPSPHAREACAVLADIFRQAESATAPADPEVYIPAPLRALPPCRSLGVLLSLPTEAPSSRTLVALRLAR